MVKGWMVRVGGQGSNPGNGRRAATQAAFHPAEHWPCAGPARDAGLCEPVETPFAKFMALGS